MSKLFLIKQTKESKGSYVTATDLETLAKNYKTFYTIELVSEKVVHYSLDRYELLKEAYDFINKDVNTFNNNQRVDLEDRIRKHLDI